MAGYVADNSVDFKTAFAIVNVVATMHDPQSSDIPLDSPAKKPAGCARPAMPAMDTQRDARIARALQVRLDRILKEMHSCERQRQQAYKLGDSQGMISTDLQRSASGARGPYGKSSSA